MCEGINTKKEKITPHRKEGTQERKILFDHDCLFMSHFESMQLEKKQTSKQKPKQMEGQLVGFAALLKKGMMMEEYVFTAEATLYSVAVSLLLTLT